MGVKLDWDIESEQGKHKQHKEDFKERSQRYFGFLRLVLLVAVFVAMIGAVVYVIVQRWNQVNTRLESLLVESVQAEIAALRIGDYESYRSVQPPETEDNLWQDWLLSQENRFNEYQQLKSGGDVLLTGNVLDVTIVGQSGRVQVEEIIGGTPYIRTWTYFHFPELDGWRHMPLATHLWGDVTTLETPHFVVRYRMLDDPVAQSLAVEVERWLGDACSFIECANLPPITFDIITDPLPEPLWAANEQNAWQMVIASPYLGRARADKPFDTSLQIDAATLLAERLANMALVNGQPVNPHDAYFLRAAIVAWMVGRFVQLNPDAHLMESLATNYGTNYVGQLLATLQPTADIGVLSTLTGAPSLAEANLDWRDFIEWRLNTEITLIQIADEANWQRLYDFRDEAVRQIAYSRYNANAAGQTVQVIDIVRMTAADGTPQLQARVRVNSDTGGSEMVVIFNLVNNVWLRAS